MPNTRIVGNDISLAHYLWTRYDSDKLESKLTNIANNDFIAAIKDTFDNFDEFEKMIKSIDIDFTFVVTYCQKKQIFCIDQKLQAMFIKVYRMYNTEPAKKPTKKTANVQWIY